MSKIGLIAGGGTMPGEFIDSAKRKGDEVIAFAINGMASEEMVKQAKKIYWLDIGQWTKFIFLMLKERTRRVAMVGKVNKKAVYTKEIQDRTAKMVLGKMKDKKDYAVLDGITRNLKRIGIEIMDTRPYLKHLLPEKGILTKKETGERVRNDIRYGYKIAKEMAGMDVGQTVIIKNKNVVAVEAMEGTDDTIERAARAAGEGCVMVKVSRPDQDMRWDVPTVGMKTIENLSMHKYSALAVESGKMYFLQKDEFIRVADISGIVVEVL